MLDIIKESESPEKFEQQWTELMETTNLSNNEWLINMYAICSRWVPTYVKHVFSAGMSSGQKVESNPSFFKRYVNKNNSLMDFITRFNRALAHQRHQELVANYIDMVEQSRQTSIVMMEQQMVHVYTKHIFLLFQKEVKQSGYHMSTLKTLQEMMEADFLQNFLTACHWPYMIGIITMIAVRMVSSSYIPDPASPAFASFYIISKTSSSVDVKVYIIQRFEEEIFFDRHRKVTYYAENDFISCSCRMFVFDGYPCRHMLCYLKKKQILLLPDKYILKRWTKNAKVGFRCKHLAGLSTDDGSSQSLMVRHGLLSQKALLLVDNASLTDACSNFLLDEFDGLNIRLQDIDDSGNIGMSKNRSKSRDETEAVSDPNAVRTKGCGKRLKSSKEKAMSQSNRTCRVCNVSGRDKRTCLMLRHGFDGLDDPYRP